MSSEQLAYAANALTVLVLGALALWALSLVAQGKLAAALRALSGGR